MPNTAILVTGGAGFIGTHLVNKLIALNPEVEIDVVDNLCNSSMPPIRQRFFDRYGVKFYNCTVADFKVPDGRRYNEIYHLASPVGPAGVLKYAGRMGLIILQDALAMADLALEHKAQLLAVSTSEVYGKHPEGGKPQKEDIPKVVPSNVTVRLEYGTGKLLAEIALLNLAKVNPLRVNFVRPFNIVGPYQNGAAGFVLPRFVEAALADQPLTIFGDGKQVRTFTHVADIVGAFVAIMSAGLTERIYNVGNPVNICSIEDLARKVITLSGSNSPLHFVDPQTLYGSLYEEAWNKIPDIEKIVGELGWMPTYELDEILKEEIAFARGELNILDPDIAVSA